MEPPAAPLIPGVGDEVTLVAGVAALVLALVLAWLSTYVADGRGQLLGTGDAAVIRLGPVPPSAGPAGAAEAPEPPRAPENAEEKTEEEEGAAARGDSGSPPDPGLEQLLDVRSSSQGPAEPGASGAGDSCRGLIKIRFKFLNDTEKVAVARPQDTVGFLKSKYFPGQESQMKLIYRGQLLQDEARTLRSLHITDNCVIHCHRSRRATAATPAQPSPADPELPQGDGTLMLPTVVVVLVLSRYFCFSYWHPGPVPAAVSLTGVVILVTCLTFALYVQGG